MTMSTPVYVHTSYYGNTRQFPADNSIIVACSRSIPTFFSGIPFKEGQAKIIHWKEIAPTYQILNAYGSLGSQSFLSKEMRKQSVVTYINDYVNYVLIPYERMEKDFWILQNAAAAMGAQHIFICCYEQKYHFCHRRVWAEYMKQRYGYIIDEYLETRERMGECLEEWVSQTIELEVRKILKRRKMLS